MIFKTKNKQTKNLDTSGHLALYLMFKSPIENLFLFF